MIWKHIPLQSEVGGRHLTFMGVVQGENIWSLKEKKNMDSTHFVRENIDKYLNLWNQVIWTNKPKLWQKNKGQIQYFRWVTHCSISPYYSNHWWQTLSDLSAYVNHIWSVEDGDCCVCHQKYSFRKIARKKANSYPSCINSKVEPGNNWSFQIVIHV